MEIIELTDFDDSFYRSIPGYEEAKVTKKGVFYTILVNKSKAGIVGYLPGTLNNDVYFVRIVIAPLKAHLKAGFKELDLGKLNSMRKKGFLKESQTRFAKQYQ